LESRSQKKAALVSSSDSLAEIDWFYRGGLANVFPDKWERFIAPVPTHDRHDLLAAYSRLLSNPDKAVSGEAAHAWCRFEAEVSSLVCNEDPQAGPPDAVRMEAVARTQLHYFSHACFLDDGQLVRNVRRLTVSVLPSHLAYWW
jgi:proline iminopeptidase